jgi:hypothetical protein
MLAADLSKRWPAAVHGRLPPQAFAFTPGGMANRSIGYCRQTGGPLNGPSRATLGGSCARLRQKMPKYSASSGLRVGIAGRRFNEPKPFRSLGFCLDLAKFLRATN